MSSNTLPSGKIFALTFIAQSEVVFHFESITTTYFALKNRSHWLPQADSDSQSGQINFSTQNAAESIVFDFSSYFIDDVLKIAVFYRNIQSSFISSLVNLFKNTFSNVTGEILSEKSISNHCELCYDLWRRILQFGSIHQIDEEKLKKSTIFNPNFDKISKSQKFEGFSQFWSSNSVKPENIQIPELTLLIKEKILLSNGTTNPSASIHGEICLSARNIPSMSTVDLTLSNPDKIAIHGSKSSEYSDLINFDLSTNTKSVGSYDLALAKAPIQFSRKVRILKTDKLIEMRLRVISLFPKNTRATDVEIFICLPPETLNVMSVSELAVAQNFSKTEKNKGFWKISSLFGGADSEITLSLALSKITPLSVHQLRVLSVSYVCEDFCFSKIGVKKFRLCDHRKNPIKNSSRKIATFCSASKLKYTL